MGPCIVTGRVTNSAGYPEQAVVVRIDALSVATTTAPDGTYRLVIPDSRIGSGREVRITTSRVGLAPQSRMITVNAGAELTQNFQLGRDAP